MGERFKMAETTPVATNLGASSRLKALCDILTGTGGRLTLIDGLEAAFEDFVRSKEPQQALVSVLHALARNTTSLPEGVGRGALNLFRNDDYTLYVQKMAPPSHGRTIITLPGAAIFAILNPGATLHTTKYRLPPGTDLSVFDPTVRIQKIDSRKLESSSAAYSYVAEDIVDNVPDGEAYILKLAENRALPYQWVFDAVTLHPLLVSATLPSLGRFETLIDMALAFQGERIERENAIEFFEFLISHPLHNIRWKAVQSLGKVDRDRALRALVALQNDPHPHVRKAARTSVTKLSTHA